MVVCEIFLTSAMSPRLVYIGHCGRSVVDNIGEDRIGCILITQVPVVNALSVTSVIIAISK